MSKNRETNTHGVITFTFYLHICDRNYAIINM